MAHFIDTPRTDAADKTRMTLLDFTEMPSFTAPAGKDDLLNAVRNAKNGLATPRMPLASKSRNVRNEFTPLLHSAVKNAAARKGKDGKENKELAIPMGLKPEFQPSSPNVPDASSMDNSSIILDRTPVPQDVNSSSFENSTPMALPQGQLDGGNVLTLREQEAKLEKLDKENFGLKLKIHFLEENLGKSGSEWSQQALRENTELKTSQATLEWELRKYRKQLTDAEKDLQSYKQQLHDYAKKVQRRHADEALNEELDRLKRMLEDRDNQLAEMQLRMESAENTMQSMGDVEKLRDDIEQLEAELRSKNRELDERDDDMDALKARLDDLEQGAGSVEKIQEQLEHIEELEAELKQSRTRKNEDVESLQEELETVKREHSDEIQELRRNLESAERAKRDQLREFEARLQAYNREKNAEIEDLRRQALGCEKDKADEIESLELRVKLAESKGDNQSQLAQQAADDARNQMKQVAAEKDLEIQELRTQVDSLHMVQDKLDACQRQLEDYAADTEKRHEEERLRDEVLTKLRDALAEREREVRQLRNTITEQGSPRKEVARMREALAERDREIASLQKKIEVQCQSMDSLRTDRIAKEQAWHDAQEDVRQLRSSIEEKDRQIETGRKVLEERLSELEVLRDGQNEPDTQIEGMQSIIRRRDNDLEDLRDTVNELEAKLASLQMTADERLQAIEDLQQRLMKTRQDLEDEIQVLEASLDDAEDEKHAMQSQVKILESQLEDTKDIQGKLSPMGKELRTAQREQERLQKRIDSLERDRALADQERESLHRTIEQLGNDLRDARESPKLTPSRDQKLRQLEQQLELLRLQLLDKESEAAANERDQRQRDSEMKELKSLLQSSNDDLEAIQAQLTDAQRELTTLPKLRDQLRQKERVIETLQAESTRELHSKAQEGREESGRLRSDIMTLEKKHMAELKGLAKQITFLRERVDRERRFRDGLGFQKEWFLMNVEMYTECNKADLRLLEDMGITPSVSSRSHRPTLKIVGKMAIFLVRARRLAARWEQSRRVQSQLVGKLESMKSRKIVTKVGRTLPLGTR